MFKKLLISASILAFAAASAESALAGAAKTASQSPSPGSADWEGRWTDAAGALVVVLQRDGMLEVHGSDRASMYRLVCAVARADPTLAECAGDGVNHEGALPRRFIYSSRWRNQGEGKFTEEWQATLSNEQRSGRALFQRKSSPAQ